MKSTIFNCCITLLLSVISLTSAAQTAIPKGKATLIEFTNTSAKFKVPEGKTWYIYNVFCESLKDDGLQEKTPKIALKSINNYNSTFVVNYPLVFPEKTSFEFEVLNISNAKGVMTYVEVDN